MERGKFGRLMREFPEMAMIHKKLLQDGSLSGKLDNLEVLIRRVDYRFLRRKRVNQQRVTSTSIKTVRERIWACLPDERILEFELPPNQPLVQSLVGGLETAKSFVLFRSDYQEREGQGTHKVKLTLFKPNQNIDLAKAASQETRRKAETPELIRQICEECTTIQYFGKNFCYPQYNLVACYRADGSIIGQKESEFPGDPRISAADFLRAKRIPLKELCQIFVPNIINYYGKKERSRKKVRAARNWQEFEKWCLPMGQRVGWLKLAKLLGMKIMVCRGYDEFEHVYNCYPDGRVLHVSEEEQVST